MRKISIHNASTWAALVAVLCLATMRTVAADPGDADEPFAAVHGAAEKDASQENKLDPADGDMVRAQQAPATRGAGAQSEPAAGPRIDGSQAGGRWREGSRLIDQLGRFKGTGERITFFSSDKKLRFDCLENLSSERIGHTISENPDQLEWVVSGTLTECHGTNYLLVTRAQLKTKAPRTQH